MEISFTSKLIPVKSSEFCRRTASFNQNNFVDYPWTVSTSRVATDVYTNNICDCSVCLITDGQKALLMHLSPARKGNHDFSNVLKYISNNMDLNNKDLQSILIGSKPLAPSLDIFNKFKNLLNILNIPTTILENGKGATHIAYRTCTDEVIISNIKINKLLDAGCNNRDAIFNGFENVKISDCDYI